MDASTKVILHPREVWYVSPLHAGRVQFVKVLLHSNTPRVLSYLQTGLAEEPVSQSIDDLNWYVEDAKKRLSVT